MKILYLYQKYIVTGLLILIIIILISINGHLARRAIVEASGQYREDIPIYSVDCQDKKCSITFDCAWGADDIPEILDILDRYNAKGTFFIVGLWAEKFPDMVKLISERGHTVANHGYSHAHMAQLPESKIEEEIERCTDTLEKITGERTNLFRPPYGEYNAATIKTAKKLGYFTIQWDVDSLDWKPEITPESIISRVINKTKPGSILLFHNDTKHTAEVLPVILQQLKSKGFTFVPVSELIYRDNFFIDHDGTQRIKK